MVYIPFPRVDLNTDADLEAWRLRINKTEWGVLKPFLARQARLIEGIHPLPKCWFSELPQGDMFAQDVEHFRPKNRAAPLKPDQVDVLAIKFRQLNTEGSYGWLEFDYRNYRLVSAITNRGGAKHIYFPLAENTNRLNRNELPWDVNIREYPYFLDPTNAHDASLLSVLPNGKIQPRTPITDLADADFINLPQSWHSYGFNYVRALVTIKIYRLDEKIFEEGRKEVYNYVNLQMERLRDCLPTDGNQRFERLGIGCIKDLTIAALPSAPFSLAARCALEAYVPPMGIDESLRQAIAPIPRQILDSIDAQIAALTCSWENP